MITIQSFLGTPEGGFTPVEDCTAAPPDVDYIDGALSFVVNGVEIIDKGMWDLVDQLWAYFVTILEEIKFGPASETYFPDQPLKVTMRRLVPGYITIEVDAGDYKKVSVDADEEELFTTMKREGIKFFEKMNALTVGNSPSYDSEIRSLRTL